MRITVHVPDNLGPQLKRAAHSQGMSVSALTAKALEEYLKRNRKRASGDRLLQLIRPGSVPRDALEELEKDRANDRA